MWHSILFAAVALFSQIGGTGAQQYCSVLLTYKAAFQISSDNQWSVQTYWNNPECLVEVTSYDQQIIYGSGVCSANAVCDIPVNIVPKCVGGAVTDERFLLRTDCPDACYPANSREFTWTDTLMPKNCEDPDREYIECDSKKICPAGMVSDGPGCYCKNGLYLYQPTNECVDPAVDARCQPPPGTVPSVNLFVQLCIEVGRPLAITWNPDIPITKYEVRDYTGDLVVSGSAQGTTGQLTITAPPVGIYKVTVFGADEEGIAFNESAIFFTKEENKIVETMFSVNALPDANGVTACFGSSLKDVSYLCQEGSGPQTECTDCQSYSRADGTETVTIHLLSSGVEVDKQSFEYRV